MIWEALFQAADIQSLIHCSQKPCKVVTVISPNFAGDETASLKVTGLN